MSPGIRARSGFCKLRRQDSAVPYREWHPLVAGEGGGPRLKFQPAGHILGSAYVECDVRSAGQCHRVVFSGDLGAPQAPLLRHPGHPTGRTPWSSRAPMATASRGPQAAEPQLRRVVERALSDGGTLLIPAFSIGRTQELLYELEAMIHPYGADKAGANPWRDLDIVVDSPLATSFTQVYRKLRPFWDEEALAWVRAGRHPLAFEQLTTVRNHAQHQTR